MDIYAWNRKDALPEETTNKFNEILKKLGIETFVVSEEQYNNLWFSNRIEIKGLNNIGTNGKGVTPQYTMASALGEFMERLQSGMLIDYLYPFFNPKTDMAGDINLLADSSKKFFGDILSNYKEAELNAIINDSMVNSRSLNFIDISTNENFLIPERLINVLCGTNGIAAGNTFEEAFVQGISEIFERYVLQYIYKEQYSDLFKVFNESVYENLNSYNLIRAIKERKYHVYVIDCSLNGKVPVVGVLIFDQAKTKYYFKLGSDVNMDIALQRCITEIFQGNSFDINFRFKMCDFYETKESEEDFWFDKYRAFEHTKAEINGTGALPRGFFRCLTNETSTIRGFMLEKKGNKEAATFMVSCCNKLNKRIAIANYTVFGVPCIRILIPELCASYYYPGSDLKGVIENINKFYNFIVEGKLNTHEALDCLTSILEYPAYTYEFSMNRLLCVVMKEEIGKPYIYNPYLFVAYLAIYLNELDVADKYLSKYNKEARINDKIVKMDAMIMSGIRHNVSKQQLLEFAKLSDVKGILSAEINKIFNIKEQGMQLPCCPGCSFCSYKEVCSYPEWNKIRTKMKEQSCECCEKQLMEFIKNCH